VICDKRSHINTYEAGGISFHTGAHLVPIMPKAGLDYLTADVASEALVTDDDIHHAPTKLVCLENTMNGCVFPLSEQVAIANLAHENGIKMHLDGARVWNASVATGIPVNELCDPYDSVSLCFSKGLGAPVGSVLVGTNAFIKKARHFRKVYGGGRSLLIQQLVKIHVTHTKND
jgi:threonine aldolase